VGLFATIFEQVGLLSHCVLILTQPLILSSSVKTKPSHFTTSHQQSFSCQIFTVWWSHQ